MEKAGEGFNTVKSLYSVREINILHSLSLLAETSEGHRESFSGYQLGSLYLEMRHWGLPR